MVIQGIEITDALWKLFLESLQTRKCSFKPCADMFSAQDGVLSLGLAAKKNWFYCYCNENRVEGQILPKFSFQENAIFLQNRVIDPMTGSEVPAVFLSASCEILLDGKVAGTGHAGQCTRLNTSDGMNSQIQTVTGMAVSKALSNAGFGVVDRLQATKIDSLPFTIPEELPITPQPGKQDLVVQMPKKPEQAPVAKPTAQPVVEAPAVEPTAQPAVEAPVAESTAQPMVEAPVAKPATQPMVEAPVAKPAAQPVVVPPVETTTQLEILASGDGEALARAKAMPFPFKGHQQGKPMGEMRPRSLKVLVESASPKTPEEEAAIEAAKLILADLDGRI